MERIDILKVEIWDKSNQCRYIHNPFRQCLKKQHESPVLLSLKVIFTYRFEIPWVVSTLMKTLPIYFQSKVNQLNPRRCTRAKTEPRGLTIHPKQEYIALHSRRKVQHTPEFLIPYNQRAGIEGTISQGVRRSALRQSRYVGLAKTHLQHVFMAAGLNLCRLDAWLNNVPLAATRYSRFYALKPKTS